MIHISKKSDYGLLFMTVLATAPSREYIPLKQIAVSNNLPYKFLSQVAIDLKRKKLIKSKEGFGGGYQLAKKPEAITVFDIVTALEGPIAPVACLRGKQCRQHNQCSHRFVMEQMTQSVNDTLQSYSLKDLSKKFHTLHA